MLEVNPAENKYKVDLIIKSIVLNYVDSPLMFEIHYSFGCSQFYDSVDDCLMNLNVFYSFDMPRSSPETHLVFRRLLGR